jgi:hypothetical protein
METGKGIPGNAEGGGPGSGGLGARGGAIGMRRRRNRESRRPASGSLRSGR